jgi:hypothetical protein
MIAIILDTLYLLLHIFLLNFFQVGLIWDKAEHLKILRNSETLGTFLWAIPGSGWPRRRIRWAAQSSRLGNGVHLPGNIWEPEMDSMYVYIYTWPCWKYQNIKVSPKSNANYLVVTYCDPYHDHKYALVVGKSSRVFTQLLPNLGLPTCCGDP